MSDKDEKLTKVGINWLIPIYSNFWENPLFIKLYED